MSNIDVTILKRLFQDKPENLVQVIANLKSGGHGGGEAMEARIARLESDVSYIKRDISEIKTDFKEFKTEIRSDFKDVRSCAHRDFCMTWGGMILGFLGMAALMAKGFNWIN